MAVIKNAPTIAEKYAAQAMEASQFTAEQTRHIFYACSALVASARDAEQFAFLLMAEQEKNTQAINVIDLQDTMRGRLSEVRDQLKFISGLFSEQKFKG